MQFGVLALLGVVSSSCLVRASLRCALTVNLRCPVTAIRMDLVDTRILRVYDARHGVARTRIRIETPPTESRIIE